MCDMFRLSVFNNNISKWNVSNVTNMENMFSLSDFNNDISKWKFHNLKNISYMLGSDIFDQRF